MASDSVLLSIKKHHEICCLQPANKEDIEMAEKTLGICFPADLVNLLMICNGAELLLEHPSSKELIVYDTAYWPIEEIVNYSQQMNDNFSNENLDKKLLCFAGNGCGDQFCYVKDGNRLLPSIWVYYPTTGEVFFFAKDLEEWAAEWFSGNKYT